jgi:DNA ligase 1
MDIDTLNPDTVLQTKEFPDMFVKTDNDKLLIRRDTCIETEDASYWISSTGQDGGKLSQHTSTYTQGKQKRTAFEQAVSECESKREKVFKKSKYRVGRENAIHPDDDDMPPPMLATAKESTKIIYPCYVQRKLDGNRCLARVKWKDLSADDPGFEVLMWSRQGNVFEGLCHIEEELKRIVKNSPILNADQNEIIFDGELFTLEYPFQELNGVLKLKHMDPNDYEKDSNEYNKAIETMNRKSKMQYWIYDIARKGIPQYKRTERLELMLQNSHIPPGTIESRAVLNPIVLEPTFEVKDEAELDSFHTDSVRQGFEGTIARMKDAGYVFKKRSKELVKIKDFYDEEYEVVDIVENDGLPGTCKFVCRFINTEGQEDTFEAMPDGSMEERKAVWEKHIANNFHVEKGAQVTVRYTEKFPDGKPRFGNARIRDEL